MSYGTVGRVKVKPENRDKLAQTLSGQNNAGIDGFQGAWLMFPENREGEAVLVAIFENKEKYWANANDPEQDKRYQEFSQYFDSEPEWSDGEWLQP